MSRRDPRALFATRLRALRTKAGLSQEQLGLKAGVDRTFIGRLERGEKGVSLKTLVKISRALGMTPSELIAGIR